MPDGGLVTGKMEKNVRTGVFSVLYKHTKKL
jgi:hypothetical protein